MEENKNNNKREQWGSRFGFLMASAGSAVGLGNVWRFPYITGEYGGAAFVAFYIFIAFTFGLSLMMAEWAIGRAGRSDAVGSYRKLGGKPWSIIGWLGFIASFIIISYYSVISGWVIYYVKCSLMGLTNVARDGDSGAIFNNLATSPTSCVTYHLINMIIMVGIVIKGVSNGIEKMCKVLMPALFVILLVLVIKALTLEGASAGVKFYLMPNFSNLTLEGMLAATGQAFFSLSVAYGLGVTYGSYLNKNEKIAHLAPIVVACDTTIAFLAGLVVFPACFATGVTPSSGPELAFVTLPRVFSQMAFGNIFAVAFFVLFFIAAITSAVSMFEILVAFGMDQLKLSRPASAISMGLLAFIFGVFSAISRTPNAPKIFGKNILDASDFVANNWIAPLSAILICIFVGWIWTKGAKGELTNNGTAHFKLYPLWLFICRVVAPIILITMLITGVKW